MSGNNEPDLAESIFTQIGEYGKTRVALLKLTAVDKASEVISSIAAKFAVYLIASRAILLSSFGAAFLIGDWLGRYSYGFFVVAIVFALAGVLLHFQRDKWVTDPVARLVITKALE